jgi:predicted XRE-type DNA-binding protein
MKNMEISEPQTPQLTRGSVLDDLGFSPSEALEVKVKAEIYRDLLQYIRGLKLPQSELAALLGLHQPDVSNLLNGRISKFSLGKLIQCAGQLNLGARVRLLKPKVPRSGAAAPLVHPKRKRTVTV